MKVPFYLALTILTGYLAGMYRYPPLMALCGIEVIIFIISVCLSRRFCRALRPEFSRKSGAAQTGDEFPCVIRVEYDRWLPTGGFHVRLRAGYPGEKKRSVFQLSGKCGHGGQDLEFALTAPYCGLLQIQLERLRAYDLFSLFSFQKRLSDEMQIAVFPRPFAVGVNLSVWEGAGGLSAEEETIGRPGDAYHEIRQIREYRTGDSIRHIHWNLSAKTDQLWLKEYERKTDTTAHLVLDMRSSVEPGIEERSAFYTLLSALTLGLLKHMAAVRLYWFDMEKRGWETASIGDTNQCQDALFRLYQSKTRSELMDGKLPPPPCGEDAFRLDLGLTWYFRDIRLFQFSSETLERDIREKRFIL